MSDTSPRLNAALEGRYRIERRLGEGGMATVYLADDLKHERKVALKVLKPELAAVVGAERFLAEIKTTANLQHPHILPLFDSGEADSFLFYVMPYVEGESLRERLDREHQLPVDEAVQIAKDTAEALQAAHEQGVIHRDVKPANILLSKGRPLVSDFGIALALGAGAGHRITETGLSVGTPHYMSPEQATGDQQVGATADVYALGRVLYEMLIGEPPFTGATPQAILGKIIVGQLPPVDEQRGAVPPHVAGVVAKALEKVPADRFDTGGALARALGDVSFRWPRRTRDPQGPLGRKAGFAAISAITVLAVLWGVQRWAGSPQVREVRAPRTALSLFLPQDQLLDLVSDPSMVLSPDGTRLVYVGEQGGDRRLYVRDLGGFGVRSLDGTEGATGPIFSPDGRRVAFFAGGVLRSVSIEGGIPARIAEVDRTPEGASWGPDGTIIFGRGGSLWRVSADGGVPGELPLVLDTAYLRDHPTAPVPARISSVRWPDHLPGGGHALVVVSFGPRTTGVVDLTSGMFRPLWDGDRPYYLPSGHVVYYSDGEELSAAPFDSERFELTGPAIPIVDDALRPAGSRGRFAVSESGVLAWARGGFDRQIALVDRSGRETLLDVEPRGYRFPEASPDGNLLAVTIDPQPPRIWVIPITRPRAAQPMTAAGLYRLTAVWAPDGTRLAFGTNPGISWVPWPGGGTETEVRAGGPGAGGLYDWPLEDRMLVGSTPWNLGILEVETGAVTDWLVNSATERLAKASPDGAWIVYESDVSGVTEIYVRAYEGGSPSFPVSSGGGTEARWSADATEIFYRTGNTIMAAPVTTTPAFEPTGTPEPLFTEPYDFSNDRNWDVLPDGRFVMIKSNPNIGREVRILVNWVGGLSEGGGY